MPTDDRNLNRPLVDPIDIAFDRDPTFNRSDRDRAFVPSVSTLPSPFPASIHQPLLDAFRAATNNLAARLVAHDKAIIAAGQMTPAQAEEGAAIVSTLYALGVSATNPIPDPSITRVTPQQIENVPPIPPIAPPMEQFGTQQFGAGGTGTFGTAAGSARGIGHDGRNVRPLGTYEVAKGGTLDVDASEGVLAASSSKGTDAVPLAASVLAGPSHSAAFTLNADGSFHYVHDGSDSSSDSFTYHTNDDLQTDPVRAVSINIVPETKSVRKAAVAK